MFDGMPLFFLQSAIHLPLELFQLPEGIERVGLILAGMVVFLVLETRCGRQSNRTPNARRSYRINFGTLLVNDALFSLLSVSSLLTLADQVSQRGLLDRVGHPVQDFVAFVLLDLSLYFWHRACHAFPWLWCLHKVHHSDPFVNVSTAFRLHFLEVLLTTLVKAGFILVTGVEAGLVLLAEALIALAVMFHHANIRVPGERWLATLFTTPSLHRLHHSVLRCEHDRNFGLVFSLWDRLFGTLAEGEPARIGLVGLAPQNLSELFRLGLSSPSTPPLPAEVAQMIAEAAYYRAEKRGFAPGFELEDWLAAEREILARA
ncbi:MAG: sterol desaturase family protein [Methylohalobius sp.]